MRSTVTGIPASLRYGDEYQQWRFNLRVGNPAEVLSAIFGESLFASQHYIPLTRSFGGSAAPHAEAAYRTVVNLFNDLHFTERQAQRACDVVRKVAIPAQRIANHV